MPERDEWGNLTVSGYSELRTERPMPYVVWSVSIWLTGTSQDEDNPYQRTSGLHNISVLLQTARKVNERYPDTFTVKIYRKVRYRLCEPCYYCGARQRETDYDCDGPYEMSTCEDPQCRRGINWVGEGMPTREEYHEIDREYPFDVAV